MKKFSALFFVFFAVMFLTASASAYASLDQATGTLVEGAVGLPVSIVKLVGGLVWTVGEVIILPFTLLGM